MAGTFSRREKLTDADTSTSMDSQWNGSPVRIYNDAACLGRRPLLLLARLIFLPGLTPARDFERGRVEVSFQARLGGFGGDTLISCDRLSGVHRMDNYSV